LVVYYPAACGRSATRVPPPCHPGPVIFIHPWDMLILRAVTNFIRTIVTSPVNSFFFLGSIF
jgi:hypothetical protein